MATKKTNRSAKEKDITVIRKVADEMWESDDEHLMPGWDASCLSERDIAVRTAARAVLGELAPDSGVVVSERALGALLRYVVDML